MIARRAGPGDAAALVRLRAQLFADLGAGHGHGSSHAPPEGSAAARDGWRAAAGQWFGDRLADRASFAAFVVEDGELGVTACAVGVVRPHVPSPLDPVGAVGQLFNVATHPARRRRGQARACVAALVDWFRTETPVAYVDLHASAAGAKIYTDLGFEPNRDPAMRLAVERRAAG